METNTLWASLVGMFVAIIVYLIGGVDELVKSLTIIMATDFILGVMVAYSVRNIDSRKALKGLLKKTAMILMLIVAVQLDLVTNSEGLMRNAMILFLIGTEGISIIENLGKLGAPVPKFLVNAFSKLRDNNNDKKGS